MLLWRLIKQQYDFIIRVAATKLAGTIFATLESIIIPIPADPLLVATVFARPKRWRQLALGCTMASVIGGVCGWMGTFFSPYLYDWLVILPERVAAPQRSCGRGWICKVWYFLGVSQAFPTAIQGYCDWRRYRWLWPFTIYTNTDHWSWVGLQLLLAL